MVVALEKKQTNKPVAIASCYEASSVMVVLSSFSHAIGQPYLSSRYRRSNCLVTAFFSLTSSIQHFMVYCLGYYGDQNEDGLYMAQ